MDIFGSVHRWTNKSGFNGEKGLFSQIPKVQEQKVKIIKSDRRVSVQIHRRLYSGSSINWLA